MTCPDCQRVERAIEEALTVLMYEARTYPPLSPGLPIYRAIETYRDAVKG